MTKTSALACLAALAASCAAAPPSAEPGAIVIAPERSSAPAVVAPIASAASEPPPSDEPPPPGGDARALASADRALWRARLHWKDECEEGFLATSPGELGIDATDLGGGKQLVRVSCELGAYNPASTWFFVERANGREKVSALSFPTYEVPDEFSTRAVTSPTLRGLDDLDVKRRELSVWRKFRGVGDCGISARYRVEGGKVRVLAIAAKLACDGEPAEGARMKPLPIPRGTLPIRLSDNSPQKSRTSS